MSKPNTVAPLKHLTLKLCKTKHDSLPNGLLTYESDTRGKKPIPTNNYPELPKSMTEDWSYHLVPTKNSNLEMSDGPRSLTE